MKQKSILKMIGLKRILKALGVALPLMMLCSCVTLSPTHITKKSSLDKYKYVYIPSTATTKSTSGGMFNGIGIIESESVNPKTIITSYLMNQGYVCVQEIKEDKASQTLIVNYGEGNKRYEGFGYSAIEVTLQFIDAATEELVCLVRADEKGDTGSDAIRNATMKCLREVFEK